MRLYVQMFYLAGRGFFRDQCSLIASALTYYTLMSMVPILAVAFAIARRLGYSASFKNELLARFQDQNEVLIELFKYADAMLEQAKGGLIAGVGLAVLLFSAAFLFNNLEGIFNQIWGVKKFRSWKRMITDYSALMFIAPIVFAFASSMTVFVVNRLEIAIRVLPFAGWVVSWILFFVNLIPYGLFWLLFLFIYLFMPNAKVHFRSASLAAALTGCLYIGAQWVYIYFQVGAGRYGAIYGSMAALPLFLIWVQMGWFLLLFGAEVSHAHQTLKEKG